MNDYELIYLIQSERDDIAFAFMHKKYQAFIWKLIHLLHIPSKEHDDLFQEGLLMLHKAVYVFNEQKNKSFTRYFELILRRHFYKMIYKFPNYILFEHTDFCKGFTMIEEEPVKVELHSSLEQVVFHNYFEQRMTIDQIMTHTGYTKKQIYNTIFRIKEKYKMMV